MILRRSLVAIAWCAIALASLYGFIGLETTFDFAHTADQPIELAMIWSSLSGVLPPIVLLIGFGLALLMLASVDRRLTRIEGKV